MSEKPNSDIEAQIFSAFKKPQWDYRTLHGVAIETGIPLEVTQSVIINHPEIYRKSIIPRKDGEELYTLKTPMSGISDLWHAFKQLNNDKLK